MQDQILTIPEVAGLLRIAEKTVYALAQKGEVPAFKVGGQWRFSRTAIESWIKERTHSGHQARVTAGSTRASQRDSGMPDVKAKPKRRR